MTEEIHPTIKRLINEGKLSVGQFYNEDKKSADWCYFVRDFYVLWELFSAGLISESQREKMSSVLCATTRVILVKKDFIMQQIIISIYEHREIDDKS
jgi:hypothetical protein